MLETERPGSSCSTNSGQLSTFFAGDGASIRQVWLQAPKTALKAVARGLLVPNPFRTLAGAF